jgi:hypothetical protein
LAIIAERAELEPWFVKRAIDLCRAVGRVAIESHGQKQFGTGFLIAPSIVLTCHHVLPDLETARRGTITFDYQREADGTFGLATTVKLRPDDFFVTDQELNFTAVARESSLPARPAIPLVGDGTTRVGEPLSIFHHPQAGPLRLSLGDAQVRHVMEKHFRHDTNTQPGSSGAPLLDSGLRLVGLQHASRRLDGGGYINEAIRASAILAVLEQIHPALFSRPDDLDASEGLRAIIPVTAAVATPPGPTASSDLVDATASPPRNSIFISYAQGDQGKLKWRERLQLFLSAFKDAELDVWDDTRIEAGADWRAEIEIALKRTRVAVLLIGPSFLGSEFINQNELPHLLKAAATDGVTVLPLLTNHCSYTKTPLGTYQVFNDPKKPLEGLPRAAQNHWLQRFADKIHDAYLGTSAT